MQFWKYNNIYVGIKKLAWTWDGVTKLGMKDIWMNILDRLINYFKGFSKNEEVAKPSKVVNEIANNTNLWTG
jgi:hypothetical protein